MKIRHGFVSNSSTSSFICEVSGEIFAERDACLSDFDLVECEHEHVFLEKYKLDVEVDWNSIKERTIQGMSKWSIERHDKKDPNWRETFNVQEYLEDNNEIPTELCPICQLKHIREYDMLKYILNTLGRSQKEVEAEIRAKFKNLEAMYEEIRKNA